MATRKAAATKRGRPTKGTPAKKTPTKGAPARRAPTKAVAKRQPARETLPAKSMLGAFEQLAGAGMETMRQDDLQLPFLILLQALSPQVQRGHERYIEGAKAGDYLNTVTLELFDGDEGLHVIPVHYRKVFNEWVPRDDGGGFRGSYTSREEAEMNAEEGNDIVDTAEHYVIHEQHDGAWTEALLSMTSTKLKTSRRWNSRMKQQRMRNSRGEVFTPPSFARRYVLSSTTAENEKGFFHVPVIEPGEWVDNEEVLEQALAFRQVVAEQPVRVDYSPLTEEESTDSNDDDEGEVF